VIGSQSRSLSTQSSEGAIDVRRATAPLELSNITILEVFLRPSGLKNVLKEGIVSTHHQLYYHFVFSTKNRAAYLQTNTRQTVFEYLGGTLRGLDAIPICIGGWVDHVHILAKLKTTHQIASLIGELKACSSKHINETSGLIRKFGWQEGYGVFTVSPTRADVVKRYIQNQEIHHGGETFQEEYVRLLEESDIEYDPKYLWD
jgi:putative transposase